MGTYERYCEHFKNVGKAYHLKFGDFRQLETFLIERLSTLEALERVTGLSDDEFEELEVLRDWYEEYMLYENCMFCLSSLYTTK